MRSFPSDNSQGYRFAFVDTIVGSNVPVSHGQLTLSDSSELNLSLLEVLVNTDH